MEFNALQLVRLASARSEEHAKLVKELKRNSDDVVDKLFRDAHANAFSQFDCLNCANCCKTISPIVTYNDAERMAKALRIKPSVLVDQYLEVDTDGDYVFRTSPCPFLQADNLCSIYHSRPRACREYPHTDRKKMKQILTLTLKNASVCPVVFNVLEAIRKERR